MPTYKSALKRDRQNKKRKIRNARVKTVVKKGIKLVHSAIEEKNIEKAKDFLAQAVPAIDKAGSKRIIHKKTASRKISLLARKVNSLSR